jgi:hypothetical protein
LLAAYVKNFKQNGRRVGVTIMTFTTKNKFGNEINNSIEEEKQQKGEPE